MKPILLVTLWDYTNFGNRMQVIALNKILEERGYTVICVANEKKRDLIEDLKKFLGLIGVKRFLKNYLWSMRKKVFKNSSDILLTSSIKTIHDYKTICKINPDDYSIAITGSDQVWHGDSNHKNALSFFYLEFMPYYKRMSYAASFGFDTFPEKDKNTHKKGLNNMRFISCREENGCSLIKNLTNKVCTCVLDPTLCIDVGYWNNIEKKPLFLFEGRYVLTFFLGGENNQYKSKIEDFAQNNKLSIINIFDINNLSVWKLSLENILWLIHHANMIFTNSFHCCVFSIIFKKNFYAFQREQNGFHNMFSRISNLLGLCGLYSCIYDDSEIVEKEIDYDEVHKKLFKAIQQSKEWLYSHIDTIINDKRSLSNEDYPSLRKT